MQRQHVCVLLWAVLLSACSASDLIRNPDAEHWCGANPCDWQVEGDVRRVGTWHPNDYAVELVSDDAALIQENAKISYRDSDCFRFAMVAKIPEGVKVFLELDFLADGSVELSQRLPVSNWDRRTFKVTAPTWYSKVRFILRKEGGGRATLAELSAENINGQCSAPPVELRDRPVGAVCSTEEDCADDAPCEAGRCAGCASDKSCSETEVCALRDADNTVFMQCVPRAGTPLGAACDRDQQCETGVCADGACSECADASDCSMCLPAQGRPSGSRFWPRFCAPGLMKRKSGEACTAHSDCESGACQNYTATCEPTLSCQGSNVDCFSCAPDIHFGACR